jgi:threonylcarbamoyladenosine tRNA methylthiotransferase MtaB
MDVIHFETLGCKLNQIETESLAHAFTGAGFEADLAHVISSEHELSADIEESDQSVSLPAGMEAPAKPRAFIRKTPVLCVVNTCTVTGKAEQKARRLIRLLLKKYPKAPVLVTGCYAEVEAAAIAAIDPRVVVIPGSRKGELADLAVALAKGLAGNRTSAVGGERVGDASVARVLRDQLGTGRQAAIDPESTFRLSTDDFLAHSRASIKIQDGCNNHCSYCRIRLARGTSVSLAPAEVVSRIHKIEEAGWSEVILAGVNLTQYRFDRAGENDARGDFADLLDVILASTDHIAIRISSLYPERVDEAILPALANARVRPHFHLSVQSGSDRILGAMRRPYSAETVYRAAERLRSVKENPFLACDIITGFPGESDEDFAATLKLCADIGFAGIHAFPFSARPGTEAWDMKPKVPERIAGERVAILTELAAKNHAAYVEYWIGKPLRAIVESGKPGEPVTVLTENYLSARLVSPTPSGLRKGAELTVRLTSPTEAIVV